MDILKQFAGKINGTLETFDRVSMVISSPSTVSGCFYITSSRKMSC